MDSTSNEPAKAFLGVGWAFPIGLEPDGQIALAAYEEDVAQAIRIILGTNPGERVMRPDFGAGLNAFVFEPINQTTLESLRRRVREALVDWEPRIEVEQVAVTPARTTPRTRRTCCGSCTRAARSWRARAP